MTEPRDPGANDPGEPAASGARRGRHAAPDEDAAGALDPAPAAQSESGDSGFAGALDPGDPLLGGTPAGDGAPAPESEPVRRRHAAEGSSVRLPGWMVAAAGALALALIAWLVIALTGGDEDDQSSSAATAGSSTAAAPSPVDVASLPQVLCMGSSYVMIDTGRPAEQLLADPGAVESQFPGSTLSTIPPGCVAGSTVRDEVVLALGPFPTFEEACAAGQALQGTTFKAYAGSATAGLTPTTC